MKNLRANANDIFNFVMNNDSSKKFCFGWFNGLLDNKSIAALGLNYRSYFNIDGTNNISRNYIKHQLKSHYNKTIFNIQ